MVSNEEIVQERIQICCSCQSIRLTGTHLTGPLISSDEDQGHWAHRTALPKRQQWDQWGVNIGRKEPETEEELSIDHFRLALFAEVHQALHLTLKWKCTGDTHTVGGRIKRFVRLSASTSACLRLSVCFVCMSAPTSACMLLSLSVCFNIYLSASMFACLPLCLCVCFCVCLLQYLPVCVYVCLSASL